MRVACRANTRSRMAAKRSAAVRGAAAAAASVWAAAWFGAGGAGRALVVAVALAWGGVGAGSRAACAEAARLVPRRAVRFAVVARPGCCPAGVAEVVAFRFFLVARAAPQKAAVLAAAVAASRLGSSSSLVSVPPSGRSFLARLVAPAAQACRRLRCASGGGAPAGRAETPPRSRVAGLVRRYRARCSPCCRRVRLGR